MAKVEGEVQFYKATKKTNRNNKQYTLFSFKLNDEWFNCGFDDPKVSQGDSISFEFTKNEYGNEVDVSTVEVLSKAPPPSTGSGTTGEGDDLYQRRTSYRTARSDAIRIIELALANECLVLPKTVAKRYDVLVELVYELTDDLLETHLNLGARDVIDNNNAEEAGEANDE